MEIRHSTAADLPRIMEIYAYARQFMADTGNPRQWGLSQWPPQSVIEEDIAQGTGYVCVHEGRVVGVFCFFQGVDVDPTYREIFDGAWLEDSAYGVVHRLAGDGSVKGIGQACLDWAFDQCGHMRVDTHGDNKVLQRLLVKCGYTHCGTIYVQEDNDPRLAYEKIASR